MSVATLFGCLSVIVQAPAPAAPQASHDVAATVVHEDLQYSHAARQPRRNRLDLYLPPQAAAPPPLIMFVHGGNWTGGRKEHFVDIGLQTAARGLACAVINMRQFPFARPEHMVADCGDALGYLHRRANEFGYDGERLFVMGHSSGAHLASWLALDQARLAAAGVPRRAVRGAILLSGVYEVRPRHPLLDPVFGSDPARRAVASSGRYIDAGDPPVFLAWGEHDLPCLGLGARMLRDALREHGVPVTARQLSGRNHVDYLFRIGKADDPVVPELLAFVQRCKGEAPPRAVVAAPVESGTVVLWVVAAERERAVAATVAAALRPHGIEVVVCAIDDPEPRDVAAVFRGLRAARERERAAVPTFVAGVGRGALAVVAAPLTRAADGLCGRIVAGCGLGSRSAATAGRDGRPPDLAWLWRGAPPAQLLSLQGDRDEELMRRDAFDVCVGLLQRGIAAHPVELAGTTAAAALADLRADDDLLVPLLRAFLRP